MGPSQVDGIGLGTSVLHMTGKTLLRNLDPLFIAQAFEVLEDLDEETRIATTLDPFLLLGRSKLCPHAMLGQKRVGHPLSDFVVEQHGSLGGGVRPFDVR